MSEFGLEAKRRQCLIGRGPSIDMNARCLCGHIRREHNRDFGCMNWDDTRDAGWCKCDGFTLRSTKI